MKFLSYFYILLMLVLIYVVFNRILYIITFYNILHCRANFYHYKSQKGRTVLRWWRNRTGRPLSPPQIHQKNIWTLNKFHKTTSECWQRTSGTQKSSPLSSKGGRKNIKDNSQKEVGTELHPWKGVLKKREVSKHQETLSLASLWQALEAQRTT